MKSTINKLTNISEFESKQMRNKQEIINPMTMEIKYNDGTIYYGCVQNGLPHGQGILNFTSGNEYKGNFLYGMRDGYGEFYYSQKKEKYVGYWKNDVREGRGDYYFSDGSLFRGKFKLDVKHGKGEKISNGLTYSGNWVWGAKQGMFKFKKISTNEISMVEYKDNKIVRIKRISSSKHTNKIKKIKSISKKNNNKNFRRKQKKFGTNQLSITQKVLNENNFQNIQNPKDSEMKRLDSNLKINLSLNKFSGNLSEIGEVSETSCSVISEESIKPCLFDMNNQSYCSERKKEKFNLIESFSQWRSGVDLLSNQNISSDCFRLQNELKLDEMAFGKNERNREIKGNSTSKDQSEGLNNSDLFDFEEKAGDSLFK